MRYLPFDYESINIAAGSYFPSEVKTYDNLTFAFWERSLFQRALSVLKFTLPDAWTGTVKDFFNLCLFGFGHLAIFNTDKYGLTFQPCTLSGYDWFYQPTRALVANPLDQFELTIGEDCEILKLSPDFRGIVDIITYYAEKLSCLDNAINISIINSKFAFMVGAKSKTAAEALKKMFDNVNKGIPAVFYDKTLVNDRKDSAPQFESIDLPNVKENYLLHDQLQDAMTLINNFDAEIGIPTIPYQKKERMVTSEAESRVIDSTSRSVVWFETLTASIDKIKQLYPDINLSVELRYPPEKLEGGADDGDS